MEQIAVSFTKKWSPATWLTPSITILGRDGTVYVNGDGCKELWYWWYIYNFKKYSPDKVYLYQFDWGNTLDDYDRYKYWGNEFDAYSNKYSWGRTAAPYFTSINWRFDKVDEAFKDAAKNRYNDSEVKKAIREVKNEIKWKGWFDVYEKLTELSKMIEVVNSSIKSESSSKWVSTVNEKLDLLAEYLVKMKEDVAKGLWLVWDTVMQWISDSNQNINEWVSKIATAEQLLEQATVITEKMQGVLDTFVRTQMEWILPREVTDRYDVNLTRKDWTINQWLNEWVEEWVGEWLDEWLWEAREMPITAPVDMQGIAEPIMPTTI